MGVAPQRVQARLQRFHIQPRQIGDHLAERAQPLGGVQVQRQRGGIHRQTEAMQGVLQRAQGQRPALLGLQPGLQRHDPGGAVPEAHVAALFVFDQMGGEHLCLRPPWAEHHHQATEPRILGLGPELPQGQQPGVAAGLDDVVRLARSLRHGERAAQPAGTDRLLDVLELGVPGAARVVLVGADLLDAEFDLAFGARAGLRRQAACVVARVPDGQGLRHAAAALIERRLAAAHDDTPCTRRPSASIPRRLGISSHARQCITDQALGIVPSRRRSC